MFCLFVCLFAIAFEKYRAFTCGQAVMQTRTTTVLLLCYQARSVDDCSPYMASNTHQFQQCNISEVQLHNMECVKHHVHRKCVPIESLTL